MKGLWFEYSVTDGACESKMWAFIRIFLHIVPVATSAYLHCTPSLIYIHFSPA